MLFRSIRFFFLIFSLAFSSSLFAQDNYQQWVNDITSRLDKTAQLVQQGNTDDARTEVQMAYFEVFETSCVFMITLFSVLYFSPYSSSFSLPS